MATKTNEDEQAPPTADSEPAQDDESYGYARLLDQVDRDIVGWQPEPGAKLFGKVVDITEGESEYGKYPLIVIESPLHDQLVGLHCFHTILKREIEGKLKARTLVIGSSIAVSYRGKGESVGGRSAAEIYRVAVTPPTTE